MAGVSVFERQVLPSGLRLLTADMPTVQSVTCFVMLAAGSRYEHAENRGIAHFAEHMFFKGTERRPTAKDIATEVDAMGAEFNAFTGKEYTGYYIRCAADNRDQALDVLVDMVRHSKFDAEELEREKGVILEEMNMYFDTPRDYIGTLYEELMFGDNPLGWETLGTRDTIKAATRETFLDYVGTWYRPNRMVVGVAGNIGPGLLERVEELLADLDGKAPDAPDPIQLPDGAGRLVKVHNKASDQAHISMGVPSYPIEHPDRYALQLLATVLGSGMSSRLFTEVRERRGLAYYVYAINHSYTEAGTLYSQAGVDINRIDDAVTTIAAELKRIADEPVGSDELEKARGLAKGRFVLQTEAPQGLLLYGLRREVLEGRAIEPQEMLDALDAVTAEDIQRVAQDVIARGGLRLAVIGPFEDASRFEALLAG
jgi:predicted Zn-dependent peptidase